MNQGGLTDSRTTSDEEFDWDWADRVDSDADGDCDVIGLSTTESAEPATEIEDRTAADVFGELQASAVTDTDEILGSESPDGIIDRADEPTVEPTLDNDLFDQDAFDELILSDRQRDGEFLWVATTGGGAQSPSEAEPAATVDVDSTDDPASSPDPDSTRTSDHRRTGSTVSTTGGPQVERSESIDEALATLQDVNRRHRAINAQSSSASDPDPDAGGIGQSPTGTGGDAETPARSAVEASLAGDAPASEPTSKSPEASPTTDEISVDAHRDASERSRSVATSSPDDGGSRSVKSASATVEGPKTADTSSSSSGTVPPNAERTNPPNAEQTTPPNAEEKRSPPTAERTAVRERSTTASPRTTRFDTADRPAGETEEEPETTESTSGIQTTVVYLDKSRGVEPSGRFGLVRKLLQRTFGKVFGSG